MPSGAWRSERLHFSQDGTLRCRCTRAGVTTDGVVEGYVSSNTGGHKAIIVRETGEPTVVDDSVR